MADKIVLDFDVSGSDMLYDFNRYRIKGAYSDYAQLGPFYVFMTSPQLNLAKENTAASTLITTMRGCDFDADILAAMSYGTGSFKARSHRFVTMFTNEAGGFTPGDVTAQTVQAGETLNKLRQVYLGEDNDSRSGGTFNIEYSEKPGLPITKAHAVWYEYAQGARRGLFVPTKAMRQARAVDYQAAMYFFLLEPDCRTIQFWARYVGVVPTGIPWSAFAGSKGSNEPIKIGFQYSYVYKQEMLPEILSDFNAVGDYDPGEDGVLGYAKSAYDSVSSIAERAGKSAYAWITGGNSGGTPWEGLEPSVYGPEDFKAERALGRNPVVRLANLAGQKRVVPVLEFDNSEKGPVLYSEQTPAPRQATTP